MDWALAAITLYLAGAASLSMRVIGNGPLAQVCIRDRNILFALVSITTIPVFIAAAAWCFLNMQWYFALLFIMISILQPLSIAPLHKLRGQVEFLLTINTISSFLALAGCLTLWIAYA